jgi:uncharacterized protein YndB with AHSA1/START domain
MQKLNFSITINASAEKIWKILWEDATYRQWTSVFSEGSYALSTWKEGARVHFMAPSGDGMFSEIAKLVPNQHMAFRHLGTMKNGKEQAPTEETKAWEGAMETYTLKENGSSTELSVSIDSVEDYVAYFEGKFPLALAKVKEIAEK